MFPRPSFVAAFAAALLFLAGSAGADTVLLVNGDRISGEVVGLEEGRLVVASEELGELRIDLAAVRSIDADTPLTWRDGLEGEIEVLAEEAEGSAWSGQIEFGGNLSRGNTERQGINFGFLAAREVTDNRFEIKGRAVWAEEDKETNTNEQTLSVRDDVKFDGWYMFALLFFERDEFEDLDLRAIFAPGVGIILADEEDYKAKVEGGPTVTYENYRSDRDADTEMEARVGFYGMVKVFDQATITEALEIYPSITDAGEYRLVSETVFEQPLSESLFFKLAVINEYNSDVEDDVDEWDLKVLASLVLRF